MMRYLIFALIVTVPSLCHGQILVMVGGDFCPPCRAMKAALDRMGEPYVYIDVQREPARAATYRIGNTIPQLLVYETRTKLHQRLIGGRSEGFLRNLLTGFRSRRATIKSKVVVKQKAVVPWPSWQPVERHPVCRLNRATNTWHYNEGNDFGEDLRRHLAGSDHNIRLDLLTGLTDAQLRLIHSHDHEHTLPAEWKVVARAVPVPATVQVARPTVYRQNVRRRGLFGQRRRTRR